MPPKKCPACGRDNAPARTTCIKCGGSLGAADHIPVTREVITPERKRRVESIASVLLFGSFFVAMVGGGLVIFVLQLAMGNKLLDSPGLMLWGFMAGAGVTAVAIIYGTRRWKAHALGMRFTGGVVAAPRQSPLAGSSRKELIVVGALLALFAAYLVWDFGEWEHSGRERRINAILYGLYALLGKWGLAALMWAGSLGLIWQGFRRRKR